MSNDLKTPRVDALSRALVAGLRRYVMIEAIFDEMARRQGEQYGPTDDLACLTDEFKVRFEQASAAMPESQSCDDFVREFVDQWPEGVGAVRVDPAETLSPLARPPYSRDGLWPAFLKK